MTEKSKRQRLLRERAEALLNPSGQNPADLSLDGIRRLIHDLSVYQIELELQNEDLRHTQSQLEETRDRYARLYHQAPVGYLTLDVNGVIHEANRTFMEQIGFQEKPHRLMGKALADFMTEPERDIFFSRFRSFFGQPDRKSIDVTLCGKNGQPFYARLTGCRDTDDRLLPELAAQTTLLLIVHDISAQKATEDALRESEEQFRSYYDLGLIGMAILSPGRQWVQFNNRMCEILGYTREELATLSWVDLTHPDDLQIAVDLFRRAVAGQADGQPIDKRCIRRDGRIIHTVVSVKCIRHPDGSPRYFMLMVQDITQRKQAEEMLREREVVLRSITDAAQDAIVVLDPKGEISFWNPAAEHIFGYTEAEALGQNLHQMLAPERYREAHNTAFVDFQRTGRGEAVGKTLALYARCKDGKEIAVALSLSAVRIQGRWQAVGIVRDETERQAQERELLRLATTDYLTGLANRRHFLEKVDMELERFKRYGRPAALLMMDMDHFKQVNDTYGHAIGDRALQHFAAIAQGILRRTDLLGRIGGEEFAALLPDADLAGAEHLAERLRAALATTPVPLEVGGILSLSISIGVTPFLAKDGKTSDILGRADRAMYRAKDQGRNRVETEKSA